jgi:hypothetical protein
MASTYSTSLKLELIGSGDQSGTWGTTTNTNLGTLLEQAIVGQTTITMANADYTLTDLNGASDEARNAAVIITGSQNASYSVICPAQQKIYIITNSLSAGATAYFKPTGGSALTIANGNTVLAYCTGTAMVALNYVATSGSATTATTATTATNLAAGSANVIPYQTASGTTSFLPTGTSGQVLQSNGSATAPTWVAASTTASSLVTTNFSITESGGKLVFKYGATTIASMDSSGNLTTLGSNIAGGTP